MNENDEFETGFYDEKRLIELQEAQVALGLAFLESDLGHLVVWCVDRLNRLLIQRARRRGDSPRQNDVTHPESNPVSGDNPGEAPHG
jgi:hypothetical protein